MTHSNELVETIAPLLARFEKLDPWHKGFLDVHVRRAVEALNTGVEIAEAMQAEKRAQAAALTRKSRSGAGLRLVSGKSRR